MNPENDGIAKEEFLKYDQMTWRSAITVIFSISIALAIIWYVFGHISNPWLVVYPKEGKSIVAIITSNFLHGNVQHLANNLLIFIPVGIWALKQEGLRAIGGMLIGGVFSGAATWVWGTPGAPHLGFSGVVFALFGILLISSIRKSNALLVLVLFFFLQRLDNSFFDALRPTEYAVANHLSWIGHLGGFVGGIWSQLKDSSIALEVLLENEDITPNEYNMIAGRMYESDKKEDSDSTEAEERDAA